MFLMMKTNGTFPGPFSNENRQTHTHTILTSIESMWTQNSWIADEDPQEIGLFVWFKESEKWIFMLSSLLHLIQRIWYKIDQFVGRQNYI